MARARELVERHHPRGHRVPFGAHLRWLVEVAHPRPAIVTCLGKPDRMLNSAWRRARVRAGLPHVRVHDLKHTFGRRLLILIERADLRLARIASRCSSDTARRSIGVALGLRERLIEAPRARCESAA